MDRRQKLDARESIALLGKERNYGNSRQSIVPADVVEQCRCGLQSLISNSSIAMW